MGRAIACSLLTYSILQTSTSRKTVPSKAYPQDRAVNTRPLYLTFEADQPSPPSVRQQTLTSHFPDIRIDVGMENPPQFLDGDFPGVSEFRSRQSD